MTRPQLILRRTLTMFSFLSVCAITNAQLSGHPVAIYAPKPQYPSAAHQHGLRGSGIFACNLRPDGTVASVNVVKTTGYDLLDKAAVSALQQWRFKPSASKAVQIPVNFIMSGVRSRMAGAALERPY